MDFFYWSLTSRVSLELEPTNWNWKDLRWCCHFARERGREAGATSENGNKRQNGKILLLREVVNGGFKDLILLLLGK